MFGAWFTAWVRTQSDLVGYVAERVGPWSSRQGEAYPRVTYTQISGESVSALAGPGGVVRQRWQVDVLSTDYAEARAVARLVRGTGAGDQRLDGYRGTLGGVTVRAVQCTDERETNEPPASGSSPGVYVVTQDYYFTYVEE